MADPDPPVVATTQGPIRVLALNRPEKANALSPDLVAALTEELRRAGRDESIRVVIVTGSGRTFCAGLDLKHLLTLTDAERCAYLATVLELFRTVWRLPQPVIAAVNGAAVAGGFDLSVFCDLRIAAEDAVFAQTEILIGVNPISTPLHHLVGLGRARELGLTAARISAAEAHRIGLVNRLVPAAEFLPAAFAFAASVAARPRAALVETKRLTRGMLDAAVDEGLDAAGESILRGFDAPENRAQLKGYVDALGSKGKAAPRRP